MPEITDFQYHATDESLFIVVHKINWPQAEELQEKLSTWCAEASAELEENPGDPDEKA